MPAAFPHVAFADYALLDSGAGEKLERFGQIVVRRPDPQAMWRRALPERDWSEADLTFAPDAASEGRSGKWLARDAQQREAQHPRAAAAPSRPSANGPSSWRVRFESATLVARPTSFKHVGIFPEQSANWRLLLGAARGFGVERPRLLNLFGYTGAASVLAVRAGYEVTHVDASRTSLAWARENLVASDLPEDAIRIVLDDALAFTQREARRNARYHAIFLDPPHHGRGPKGETWQFEEGIAPLVQAVRELAAERALVVLSSYAIGCSALTLENLLADLGEGTLESGELALPEQSPRARLLPAGFCARWNRGVDVAGELR